MGSAASTITSQARSTGGSFRGIRVSKASGAMRVRDSIMPAQMYSPMPM